MAKKLLNGCLVVFAAFICPMSVIAAAGAGDFLRSLGGPGDVRLEVNSPATVTAGAPFIIDVAIDNTADSVQTLDNIDLFVEPPEAIQLTGATPAFKHSSHVGDLMVYWFETEIPAGQTLNVSLELLAHQPGVHTLELGICINFVNSCMPYRTVVDAR